MVAEKEIAAAGGFLAPVLKRETIVKARGQSIIERLATRPGASFDSLNHANLRIYVVETALGLLADIHHALLQEKSPAVANEVLYISTTRKVVDGLLDLISLEGIYPNLLPGVGVPVERRVQSVLQGGVQVRKVGPDEASDSDASLLPHIVHALHMIAMDIGLGLYSILKDRTMVDLIAAESQLAFAPSQNDLLKYGPSLSDLMEKTSAATLFPILTSLLHPTTPAWLRPHLSRTLSLLPLRLEGVRQTINFVASAAPQPPRDNKNSSKRSSGPALSLETLGHISKLLSAVPSTTTPEKYYMSIAPQLLALLDGHDVVLQRAATYVISNGILSRRVYGAPGTIGWKLFAEPIFNNLNPPSATIHSVIGQSLSEVLVGPTDLQLSLQRLSIIGLTFPNPGLLKRLLTPLINPIWGLLCKGKHLGESSFWYEKPIELLSTYFQMAADPDALKLLIDNLLWDGELKWLYSSTDQGGVEIVTKPVLEAANTNIVELIQNINRRIAVLMDLLDKMENDADVLNVFTHVSRCWLLGPEISLTTTTPEARTEDPLSALTYAKIAQEMLGRYKNKIATSPDKTIELVQHLLQGALDQEKQLANNRERSQRPSMSSLGSLSTNASTNIKLSDETTEMVSLCTSLLLAIISAPEFYPQSSTASLLNSLLDTLLAFTTPHSSFSPSVKMSARNLSATIISICASAGSGLSGKAEVTKDPQAAVRSTHAIALQHLTSSLPPVRAEGLSTLTKIISSASPILDIPSTAILLLSLLQDDEEFIYLAAIKALESLAQRHNKAVVGMLVDRYIDQDEESPLDVRLRVGEALRATVEALGGALVETAAKRVGEGMIAIAGRRASRRKHADEKRKKSEAHEKEKREAEDAWGGEVPKLDDPQEEVDAASERIAKILHGWEGKDGEEDIRIRTSALSILGVSIETSIAGMGSSIVSTAIDLAISILRLETTLHKAILRRAAAMLIMSVIRAIDKADRDGKRLGFGFAGESLKDVMEMLGYVKAMDEDNLVRGHVGEALQGLEVWRTKSLVGNELRKGEDIKFGLEGGLRGLIVNPPLDARPKPRIEEIE